MEIKLKHCIIMCIALIQVCNLSGMFPLAAVFIVIHELFID